MMTCFGEAFDKFGKHFSANPEDLNFAQMFTSLTERFLAEGKLKPHPAKLCANGLQGILDGGVKATMEGKVSGVKLVYLIADTP